MTRTGSADLSGLSIDRDARAARGVGGGPRRVAFLVGLGVAVLAIAAILLRNLGSAEVPVTVARAEALGGAPGSGAAEVLTASGYVVARQRASVSTEVAGRLARLHVEEGSRVTRGQVLGVLENQDQASAVEGARAALTAAEAKLTEERASAHETGLARGRADALFQRGLVSRSELDAVEARDGVAQARAASAAADVQNARARLAAATIAYERTFIRAPFAGAVLRKEAEVGEIVSPIPSSGGLTRGAIVTMANLASLEVEVDVNEGYVARAREGMRAEIALDAYPNDRYPGRVRQIVPTADRQKATVQVKIAFDSLDARVLPEMGAKVTLLAASEADAAPGGAAVPTAVSIPSAAVRDRDGAAVVFVVEDGRAVSRRVAPRPLGRDRVSVSGGLAAGEMVVVEGPADLVDRARVRVRR